MLSVIIVAAGASSRMGEKNKLLLTYKNKTVLAHVVENIAAAGLTEIIVVTGFEATDIRESIVNTPVHFVHNPDYKKGMTTSIQQGVFAATGSGYMICLADLVLITPDEYAYIAQKFREQINHDSKCICLPVYMGVKGNPVIFSSYYRQAILRHADMEGCKGIVQVNKEHLHLIPMGTSHVLQDIDTPPDYESLPE